MAVCNFCEREMLDGSGCDKIPVLIGGERTLDPIPYGSEEQYFGSKPIGQCPDCAVNVGGYHHVHCDQERCPSCEGQLISCSCLDEIT